MVYYSKMKDQTYKYLGISVAMIIGIFWIGFYFGENNAYKTPFVINATSSEVASVDLAPFWKAWAILDERFAPASTSTEPTQDEDKVWGAIEGLARSYDDPYTTFFPPAESKSFNEEIAGSFGGIGVEIGIQDGVLTVISPIKGTPSYEAGIEPGDKIIAIDDISIMDKNMDEAIRMIRGEVGTKVTLTLVRKGEGEPLKKTLTRATIDIPTVATKFLEADNVFVIELYNFSANSANLFRNGLREFVESGSPNLVIDLRNNPGGYLEAALDMASWFLPTGKLVATEDFGGKKENIEYKSKGYDVFNENLKMVILLNDGSASASEILAGALREHGKATLIGQKTFGKGSVQELIPITDETSLKVTVAHWLTPLGNSISEKGIVPDIEVVITAENTKNGNDPVLNRAVEFFNSPS